MTLFYTQSSLKAIKCFPRFWLFITHYCTSFYNWSLIEYHQMFFQALLFIIHYLLFHSLPQYKTTECILRLLSFITHNSTVFQFTLDSSLKITKCFPRLLYFTQHSFAFSDSAKATKISLSTFLSSYNFVLYCTGLVVRQVFEHRYFVVISWVFCII